MDKNESVREIKELVGKKQYSVALAKLENIDMQTELTESDLAVFAEVYICNKQFSKAKALLEVMFKSNASRKVISQLIFVCLIMNNLDDAEKYYEEYEKIAPNDKNCLVFRYRIDKAKGKDMYTLIETLEKIQKKEFTDEFAYDLADLYNKAGLYDKCVKKCNEIIVLSSNSKVSKKANDLKNKCMSEMKEYSMTDNKESSNKTIDIWKEFKNANYEEPIKKESGFEDIESKTRVSIELNAQKAIDEKFKAIEEQKKSVEEELKKEKNIRQQLENQIDKLNIINKNLEAKIVQEKGEKSHLQDLLERSEANRKDTEQKFTNIYEQKINIENKFNKLDEISKTQSEKLIREVANSRKLEEQVTEKDNKVRELIERLRLEEKTKSQLINQLETKEQYSNTIQLRLDKYTKQAEELEEKRNENEEKIAVLESRIEAETGNNDKLSNQIKELMVNKKELEVRIRKLEQNRNVLQKDLQEHVHNKKIMDNRCKQMFEHKKYLENRIAAVEDEKASLQNNVAGLEKSIALVQDSLKQEQQKYKNLEESAAREKEELKNKMVKEREFIKDTLTKEKEEMQSNLVREKDNLQEKLTRERDEIHARLTKELVTVKENFIRERDDMQDRLVAEKEAIETNLKIEKEEIRRRIEKDRDMYKTSLEQERAKFNKCANNNKLLEQNLRSKIDIINTLDGKLKESLQQIKNITNEKDELDQKLVKQVESNNVLKQTIDKYVQGKSAMEDQLRKNQDRIKRLEDKNNQGLELIRRLEERVRVESINRTKVEQKLKDSELQCTKLNTKLEEIEIKLKEQRNKEIDLVEKSGEELLSLSLFNQGSSSDIEGIRLDEKIELPNDNNKFDNGYENISSSVSQFLDNVVEKIDDKDGIDNTESINIDEMDIPVPNMTKEDDIELPKIQIPIIDKETLDIKSMRLDEPEEDVDKPAPRVASKQNEIKDNKASIGSFFEDPGVPDYKKAYPEEEHSVVSKLFGDSAMEESYKSMDEYGYENDVSEKEKYYKEVMQSQLLGNYQNNTSDSDYTKESINPDVFTYYYSSIQIMDEVQRGIYNIRNNMRNNNFVITGPSYYDKTELAKMIAKQLADKKIISTNKIARISGDAFNRVNLEAKAVKLLDGVIIIQNADVITHEACVKLSNMLDKYADRVVVILESSRSVQSLFSEDEDIRQFFSSVISLPPFSVDFMIDYIRTYLADRNMGISQEAEIQYADFINGKLRKGEIFSLQDVAMNLNISIESASKRKKGKGKHPSDIIVRQDINTNW